MRRGLAASVICLLIVIVPLYSQVPGQNHNVITGIQDKLRGDPFLQRQNEPVIVSVPRNPDHLMAVANDYRTVDFAGDPTDDELTHEAWIGVYKSYDRGRNWFGSLLPGFPLDTSPAGTASPLFGLAAGSDPTLAADTSGHIYLGGLAFDRSGISRVFVARYTDRNDVEGSDTISYDFAKVVDSGTISEVGAFVDKDSIAVDIPRTPGAGPAACGPVYFVYSIFDGMDTSSFRSKIMVSVSRDCGVTWSRPIKINKTYNRNQGTAIAIDPRTGTVYVAWRTFAEENGIVLAKSTNGGLTFSDPVPVTGAAGLASFDQPTSPTTFRTNGFPTIAVGNDGRIFVAWQERLAALTGSPRVVITTSANGGATWTPRRVVEYGTQYAHQVMPALSFGGGQLSLLFYDSRLDGRDLAPIDTSGQLWISGIDRRIDVRVVVATPGPDGNLTYLPDGNPQFGPSVQVSQYLNKANTSPPETVEMAPGLTAVSRPNYKMYQGGNVPFFGDYIWLAPAVQFLPVPPGDPTGLSWRFASKATDTAARSFHAIWTDNRDVVPPFLLVNGAFVPSLSGDWTQYSPPGTGQLSCVNPGSRNANVYTAEISPGVVAGSPQPFKKLVDDFGTPVQRAFVMYVENPGGTARYFRLTINDIQAHGSFLQSADQAAVDLQILPYSSIYRTVYVVSPNATGSVRVDVQEIDGIPGNLVVGGLATSVTFNPDPLNPQGSLGNSTEVHNPQISNPQVSNPQVSNPQVSNPQVSNPQVSNPQVSNPQISNPQVSNTAVTDVTWTVTTSPSANTVSAYSFISSVDSADQLLLAGYQFQLILYRVALQPSFAGCQTTQAPVDQVFSNIAVTNPQVSNPQISNPQISNPQVSNPQISNPQVSNATFAVSPTSSTVSAAATTTTTLLAAASTQYCADGTLCAPRSPDAVMVTLRIFPPPGFPPYQPPLDQQQAQQQTTQAIFAQAANTGQTEAAAAFYDITPPLIQPTVTPPPNAAGWNQSNVTVTWTVGDNGSGIAASSGCGAATVTNDTTGTTFTCSATNGAGLTNTASVTVRIDRSPPVIVSSVTPPPNAAGWNNSDVTIAWTVLDAGSGIATSVGCSPVTLTSETAGQNFTCTATNTAGLSASASVTVKLDKTPPNPPAAGVSPPPNAAGWNNTTPVTVSYSSAGDSGPVQSGVLACSSPAVVGNETAGTVVNGACTDVAGNTSAPNAVNVRIDKTPPVIGITTPAVNGAYVLGTAVVTNYACTDTLSGVATCAGPVASGTALNTAAPGVFAFTVTALDRAGNAAQITNTYSVNYRFTGFLTPLSPAGTVTAPSNSGSFNLGKVIPLKWQLTNAQGQFIADLGSLKSLKAYYNGAGSPCTGGLSSSFVQLWSPQGGAAGNSTFRFGSNQFIFNWDTSTSAPTGRGCYTVVLELIDGSIPKATMIQLK